MKIAEKHKNPVIRALTFFGVAMGNRSKSMLAYSLLVAGFLCTSLGKYYSSKKRRKMNDNKPKSFQMTDKKVGVGALLLILFLAFGYFLVFGLGDRKKKKTTPQPSQQSEQTQTNVQVENDPDPVETNIEEPELLTYEIIEENDISYGNCKRATFRVLVPDDAEQDDIDYTLEQIARDKLIDWDDVTFWAFGFSERANATGSYTKGMYEDSLPGFCN